MVNDLIVPFCEEKFLYNIAQLHGVLEYETLK